MHLPSLGASPAAQRNADGASERPLPRVPSSSPKAPAAGAGFVTVPAAVLDDYVALSSEKARDAVLRASSSSSPFPSEAELLEGEERFRAWGGFFWSSAAYEHAGFRRRYVQELFVARARLAFDALAAADAAFPQAFSHLRAGAPPVRVVSCGAGPGCDLFGADLFLRVFYPRLPREGSSSRPPPSSSFTAVDSQPAWRAACSAGLGYRFVCADYRGERHGDAAAAALAGADLVVFSHVLTDFAPENTKTFLKAVLAKMNPRGRALVLDRDDVWPGRPPKPPSARVDPATDRALLFWRKDDAAMTDAVTAGLAPPAKRPPRKDFRKALDRFAGRLIPNHHK